MATTEEVQEYFWKNAKGARLVEPESMTYDDLSHLPDTALTELEQKEESVTSIFDKERLDKVDTTIIVGQSLNPDFAKASACSSEVPMINHLNKNEDPDDNNHTKVFLDTLNKEAQGGSILAKLKLALLMPKADDDEMQEDDCNNNNYQGLQEVLIM